MAKPGLLKEIKLLFIDKDNKVLHEVGRYYVHMAAPCVADFPKRKYRRQLRLSMVCKTNSKTQCFTGIALYI